MLLFMDSLVKRHILSLVLKVNGSYFFVYSKSLYVFTLRFTDPIQRLSLTISKSDDPKSNENVVSNQRRNQMKTVVLDEGKYDVNCVASGSNPAPKVTLKMGDSTISTGVTSIKGMMSGSGRLYQETVTKKQIAVNRGTINQRIECIGVVPATSTRSVKAEFRVSNVTTSKYGRTCL